MPFFSIIIPTYNRANLIKNTIKSVLRQTFTDFELIIVDDGSTDDTENVIKSISDSRIKYFKKENGERGAARNFGIKKSEGSYITFLDSDDFFKKECLSIALNALEKTDYSEIIAISHEFINEKGKILNQQKHVDNLILNQKLLKGNLLSCLGVFIKKNIIENINFSENRELAVAEDWLVWLKLSARYKIIGFSEIGIQILEHSGRSVFNYKEEKLTKSIEILINELKNDPIFLNKFGLKTIKKIENHMNTYTSLHLAMSNKKTAALKYFFKGIQSKDELFSRRTLAIIKKIILPI